VTAIIYAFRSPGSGAVYIGKHQCDPEGWPRRGSGKLPDGYRGSGVAVRNFHLRHGDRVQWRILATVTGGRDAVNAAERRAIRLARALFGRACVNRQDGGDGFTSEAAKAVATAAWADQEKGARMRAAQGKASRVAQNRENGKRQMAAPEVRAKHSAFMHGHMADPGRRKHQSELMKAHAQTPEGKSQRARASAIGHRKRRARKSLAPFLRSGTALTSGATLWPFHPGSPITVTGYEP